MIETISNNWLSIPKPSYAEADESTKHMKKEIVVSNTIRQYAEISTAHGINYIFEEGRLPIERLLWSILVIIGFSFRYNELYLIGESEII